MSLLPRYAVRLINSGCYAPHVTGGSRSLFIVRVIVQCIILIGILQVLISFITVFACVLASPIFLSSCEGVFRLHFILFHIHDLYVPSSLTFQV